MNRERGTQIVHGPYEAAKLMGRAAAALLSNNGHCVLADNLHQPTAAMLAARLNERDAYHRALTTIAEAGTFDPESFARAVLDGISHDVALAADQALLAPAGPPDLDDEGQTLARCEARRQIVIAACAGNAAALDAAVAAFRAAGGNEVLG